jgi:AraC-like DNA-binding protein
MPRAVVSARIAVGLARTLEALGVPAPILEAALGVPRELAADPDARVPLQTLYALWERAADHLHDDPALPILVTTRVRSAPHRDVFAFVLKTSPDLRSALHAGARFLAMRTTSFALTIAEEGDSLVAIQHRAPATSKARALAIEATLAEMVATVRLVLDEPSFAPLRVELGHPRPSRIDAQRSFFGCELAYGAGRDAIVFAARDGARALAKGDPALAAYFDARCREALATFDAERDVVDHVRERVVHGLPSIPTIGAVAKGLAMSERTLRRRLSERGTSFDRVVVEARVALAQQHLSRKDGALGEIAYLVGFSEPSAFHRFFRRATGTTPAAWRAAHAR